MSEQVRFGAFTRPIDWRNRFVLPGKGRARCGGGEINVAPSLSTCAQLKRDDIFAQSVLNVSSFSAALANPQVA